MHNEAAHGHLLRKFFQDFGFKRSILDPQMPSKVNFGPINVHVTLQSAMLWWLLKLVTNLIHSCILQLN